MSDMDSEVENDVEAQPMPPLPPTPNAIIAAAAVAATTATPATPATPAAADAVALPHLSSIWKGTYCVTCDVKGK